MGAKALHIFAARKLDKVKMRNDSRLDPFSVPGNFRAYAYDSIVMAWECGKVTITTAKYNRLLLSKELGINVQNPKKLQDVQEIERRNWETGEFLVFYVQGKGYECLFKRLRDTFAHGHYGTAKQGWITIRHRFKGPRDKDEQTRIFGRVSITTIKKLVAFISTTQGICAAPGILSSPRRAQ